MIVKKPDTLLPYLLAELQPHTRGEIKRYLKFKSVSVNGILVTRHDHPLYPGDRVSVQTDIKKTTQRDFLKSKLQVTYEDESVILIHKPAGLLTVATEKVQTDTAIHQVMQYLKLAQRTPRQPRGAARLGGHPPLGKAAHPAFKPADTKGKVVFVVHRLDREVSGLILFAKNYDAKLKLQTGWEKVEKCYYAVVEGAPAQESGTVQSYLKENKYLNMYSADKADGKLSITHYKILKKSANNLYSLLEIRLETGRKHQIRVHLADLGCPIAGDDRYGAKTNPIDRLALHSYHLAFNHPRTGKHMNFTLPIPPVFNRLISSGN